jgi:DHA1 family solute carrier family 18 vesicular amine transporter 1/2
MSRSVSRIVAVGLVTLSVFIDVLAYSIAVPVLPHLSRQFGASPTVIGLLFASFGVTLLAVSIPMGAVSDRVGRRVPLVGGLLALAGSSVLFAYAPTLSWLFAARLLQGAADGIVWVVGLAFIADLYGPAERGKVMGLVMSGSTLGFMAGPTLGGWLYEAGGIRLPYLAVGAFALVLAAGAMGLPVPARVVSHEAVSVRAIVFRRAVIVCTLAVSAGAATLAMIEPVLSLHLASALDLGPAQIGLVFGAGAVIAAFLHPVFGRIADRVGGRGLTLWGLVAMGMVLPLFTQISSFRSAVAIFAVSAVAITTFVTPSLTYMGKATSIPGNSSSFGVAYGLYNVAWALGLLWGPASGGFLFEHMGFTRLMLAWSPAMAIAAACLARAGRTRYPAIDN